MSERSSLESLVPSRISTTSATSSSAELEIEKENAAVPVFERDVFDKFSQYSSVDFQVFIRVLIFERAFRLV